MSTAAIMPKAVILSLDSATFRVAHPVISSYPNTQLGSAIAASGTTMTVLDNNGFSDNDWAVAGEIGDNRTETFDVNGAVTKGTSMTVTNNLDFAHAKTDPINKIYARGVTIYGAATDGGSGTIIESIDAFAASGKQLANAQMITWNKNYTEYTLISTDTTYAFYYVVFTDGTTTSAASDYIPSTGWTEDRVIKMIEHALVETDTQLDNKNITLEQCVKWANEAQQSITQFKYQDPQTGSLNHVDWDFEVIEDTSTTVSTNEIEYALSGLTNTPKYVDSDRAIISIRLGDRRLLNKITIGQFDTYMANKPNTDVATEASSGDTTLVVDSVVEFSTSGTIYVGTDTVTYTGVTGTTTFTGIPASGTGSITATWVVDSPVWQGISPAEPNAYTVFNGKVLLTVPVKDDYDNYTMKVRMYKKLTALSEASDKTSVSFYNVFHMFIASRMERRKGNEEKASFYLSEFNSNVMNNALANSVPTVDEQSYYNFVGEDDRSYQYNDGYYRNY